MIRKTVTSRRRPSSERRGKQRLAVESLEKRELLAVVSHWTGNNTALDAVGANHGTLQSGATYAAGQVGQAFSLDGSNDRVGIADSPSLALTQSLSIEAWVKVDSHAAQHGMIFFRGDDRGGLDPYWLSVEPNGRLQFTVESLTAGAGVSAPVPLGQMIHIAGTLDDATGAMRLYINGVVVAETITSVRPFGALDPNSNPGIGIGNHGGLPGTPHNFPFDGLIDQLKVYNHALTASEVTSHFLAEKGNLQPSISISDATINEQSSFGYKGNLVSAGTQGGQLTDPFTLAYGPDGNLYVSTRTADSVLRYLPDGTPFPAPGKPGAEFVSPGAGGLGFARGLGFGPSGDLYIVSAETDEVLGFSGADGSFLGALVTAGSGGIADPRRLLFDDGYLYVTCAGRTISGPGVDAVLRYDATTGAPAGTSGLPGDAVFISSGSGGLDGPVNIVRHNGDFYVSGLESNSVHRYSASGAPLGDFVAPGSGALAGPAELVFHNDGYLYVTSMTNGKVLRYDGATGAFDEEMVGAGLSRPVGLLFESSGDLLVANGNANEIRRYGEGNGSVFAVSLSAPWPTPVTVDYATANGSAIAGSDYESASGSVTIFSGVPAIVSVPILDDSVIESDETFIVNLSNPVGATIADGQGVGTIDDDDAPTLITINDVTVTEGNTAAHYRGPFIEGFSGGHFSMLTFGPDGDLYATIGSGPGGNSIRRYDGVTGEFIDTVVNNISGPRDILFRDGLIYVGEEYTDKVLRFNASTGAFVDVFVTAGSGGINGPHGLNFGPDANGDGVGELYVSGRDSFSVVRYDGVTGAPLGTFVTSGSGGLSWPEAMTFDSSGTTLFVASTGSNQILKYNAQTGAYLGVGASTGLSAPKDVKFGPAGLLYVTSGGNDRIMRFTAAGVFVDDYVPAGSGGMDNPSRLAFGPDGNLYVTAVGVSEILRFGTENEAVFTVSLAEARNTPISVDFATANVSALAGSDYSAANGAVTFNPGVVKRTIRVPILNDSAQEATETFTVNLSNPSAGAAIGDGQGVGTILDNDAPPTKFFVVDDATANKTFEYTASGSAIENYNLNSGNAAPRGVATTAAGDKVWVVDTNNKVFVYDNGGVLLGSWTILALKQIEGITVWGNDLWVVDGKFDRVYKLDDGALRLSGQTYVNSYFDLTSGNGAPKDLVTDGAHIWVVNDANQDKVFKYTVAGASVGNWTITSGGGSPTGITLDPSNPSHLWIVDSATDRVYQYSNATTRTSGSQAAASSFALAAGNTNPQGIADPPVASSDGVERNSFRSSLPSPVEVKPEEERNEFRFTSPTAIPASWTEFRSGLSPDRERELDETIALLALQMANVVR